MERREGVEGREGKGREGRVGKGRKRKAREEKHRFSLNYGLLCS